MKSERRHELQHNYLADYLGKGVAKIEPHAKSIAVLLGVLLVASLVWGMYRSSAQGARSDATLELLQNSGAGDAEALGSIGQRYAGTAAGELAKLYQADTLLAGGINGLFEDREEAENQIKEAIKHYESIRDTSTHSLFASRATLGLARARESLGQIDLAVEDYNRLVKLNEFEAIVDLAQQRINQLKSPASVEFLAWFAKQDFRAAAAAAIPGVPGADSIPGLPNFDLPDLDPLKPSELAPETAAEMTEPKTDTPAATEPAPPADPAPAPEAAPAEPVPAEPVPAAEPAAAEPAPPAEPAPAEPVPAEPAPAEPATPAEPAVDEAAPASEPPAETPAATEPTSEPPAADPADSPE